MSGFVVPSRIVLASRKVTDDLDRAVPGLRRALPKSGQRAGCREVAIPRLAGLGVEEDRRVTEPMFEVERVRAKRDRQQEHGGEPGGLAKRPARWP